MFSMTLPTKLIHSNRPESKLYDNETFFKVFYRDLRHAQNEVIIESPFITGRRFNELLPIIKKLRRRGISVIVNTRDPQEHEGVFVNQAYDAVVTLQDLGVKVLYTAKLHRKIAIVDRQIVWEGSLNILSYSDSCEIMRRTDEYSNATLLIRYLAIY